MKISLLLWYLLEIGFIPGGDFKIYDGNENINLDYSFYVDMQTKVYFYNLYIGGQIKNVFNQRYDLYFSPDNILFMFQVGLEYDIINIGFRHYCQHPIITYLKTKNVSINYEGYYQEIYLNFEGYVNGK